MQGASGAGDKVYCLTLGCTRVVDGESFTPLILSTFGSLGKEPGVTLNFHCYILSFAVLFVYCHVVTFIIRKLFIFKN